MQRWVEQRMQGTLRQPRQRLQLQRIDESDVTGAQVLDSQPGPVAGVIDAQRHGGKLTVNDAQSHQIRNDMVGSGRSLSTSRTVLRASFSPFSVGRSV